MVCRRDERECKEQKIEKCGSDEKQLRKRTAVFGNRQPKKVAKIANGTAKRKTHAARKTSSDDMVPCLYCGGIL